MDKYVAKICVVFVYIFADLYIARTLLTVRAQTAESSRLMCLYSAHPQLFGGHHRQRQSSSQLYDLAIIYMV